MNAKLMTLPRYLLIAFVFLGAAWQILAQTNLPAAKPNPATFRISLSAGITNVFVRRAGANVFDPAYDGQTLRVGDRLQTQAEARIILISADGTTLRVGEFADLEIQTDPGSKSQVGLMVHRARLYFFHRGGPTDLKLRTRTASAAVRGTEFDFNADNNGAIQLHLLDGEVVLGNEMGEVILRTGERGNALAGRVPTKTAVIEAVNSIQWCLYYPAILDLEDLEFAPEKRETLRESFSRYQLGDVLGALETYPASRQSPTVSERIYHGALLLAVGKVTESEILLNSLVEISLQNEAHQDRRLMDALRTLIAAVKQQNWRSSNAPVSSTEWLAESYRRQSQADLNGALDAARRATGWSPRFGFAWARVAELEFSFGRNAAAIEALKKALELSPRNAQALALRGFTLAARNKLGAAVESFDQALAVDNALGNAWLGRGLCRIRRGDLAGGLEDLQTAVVVEPQRAVLRSYLGKAFDVPHQNNLAEHELQLASEIDPNDPTPWFYQGLLNRDLHRFNEAIRNIEKSVALNDNRQIYRSRLLLDQDRAVRSASLARIHSEAGLDDVAQREAAKATTHDYANYSAHLFQANSLDALRDPTRFNLRYETAWFNELLLANMLAPVGAGIFAQDISQQEYSSLFQVKKLGLTTTTDIRSDKQYREVVTQFGNFQDFSYSLDLDYQHNDGYRPNNDLDRVEVYGQFKFQLTPSDSLFFLTKYQDYHSGDNFQYYDWRQGVRTNFTFDEMQTPIILGGYHHEWSPGIHTLLLAGRLHNDQRFSDLSAQELVLFTQSNAVTSVGSLPFNVNYRSEFEAYTAELNQIIQGERQVLVFGGRFQTGQFETQTEFNPVFFPGFFPVTATNSTDDFQRATAYAYYTMEPVKNLFLTAGLSYDDVVYPQNHRAPPTSSGTERADLLGPKAALVYSPFDWVTLRGVYTRSLGGVTLDQSYRLEPTQLAGFVQTFRSVIPESVVGSVSAPTFDVYGAAMDLKFKSGTYLGIQAEMLSSDVDREIGVFDFVNVAPPILPSSTRERLNFDERSLGITLHQLIDDEWACGVSYKFTSSELNSHLMDIPTVVFTNANDTARSDLHQVGTYVLFNHSSGLFTRAEANWFLQRNTLDTAVNTGPTTVAPVEVKLPGDEFPQFNLFVGYRFPRQRGDVTFGVLNIGGDDYHLNPLNSYAELPHERVFTVQLRLRF